METIIKDGIEYKLVPVNTKPKPKHWALFVLTMPGKGSWDHKWCGDSKYFAHVAKVFSHGKPLYPNLKEGNYPYFWNDGWSANVKVTFVTESEAKKAKRQSKGFCGYDWMYSDIMVKGEIQQR